MQDCKYYKYAYQARLSNHDEGAPPGLMFAFAANGMYKLGYPTTGFEPNKSRFGQ